MSGVSPFEPTRLMSMSSFCRMSWISVSLATATTFNSGVQPVTSNSQLKFTS